MKHHKYEKHLRHLARARHLAGLEHQSSYHCFDNGFDGKQVEHNIRVNHDWWYKFLYYGYLSGFKRGSRHAPKWYRKLHQSRFRARNRSRLVQCQDWDELALLDHPDYADWMWF